VPVGASQPGRDHRPIPLRAATTNDVKNGVDCSEEEAWESTRDVDQSRFEYFDTKDIAKIARLAGRIFAQLQGKKASRVVAVPEEMYSVELGNNLARVLPSELVHLGQPTEIILLDNIANAKCLQYKMRGTAPAGRGPLVICLDESGSMEHGDRLLWSKATAVALTRVAWQDNRHVSVVHYSASVTITELPPNSNMKLLDVIKHFLNAGTKIHLALENASYEVARMAAKGDRGADVILVSDGEDRKSELQDKAIDLIDAQSARLWTVAIECDVPATSPLRARAATYMKVDSQTMRDGKIGTLSGAVL